MTVATIETMADLLARLHVPPERVRMRPPPGEATENDLLKTPRHCELIDGVLVEKAMGYYESRLATVLVYFLERFFDQHPLGIVTGEGGMVRIERGQVRIPDVGYFCWDHFPDRILPRTHILDMVPDLAVEILSPTNTAKEMERKRGEYFTGGAKLVWEVYPDKREVNVFKAPEDFVTVDENGVLDGGTVLPGFTLSVREWFQRAGRR